MVLPLTNQRPLCPQCGRPHTACICRWIVQVTQPTEVLILQHPLEVHHAKNTAGLLHRSLTHSRILVGEVFDESALHAALEPSRYTVLLYPPTDYEGHAIPASLDGARDRKSVV